MIRFKNTRWKQFRSDSVFSSVEVSFPHSSVSNTFLTLHNQMLINAIKVKSVPTQQHNLILNAFF